jgi:hypothetical protein
MSSRISGFENKQQEQKLIQDYKANLGLQIISNVKILLIINNILGI